MTTTTEPSAADLRRALVDRLSAEGTLRTPAWQAAFLAVPREAFLEEFTLRARGGKHHYAPGDPSWLPAVYQDASLVTQIDESATATSSSTAPTVMARMLEALDVRDGDRALEVGTGTGYNVALLTHRLGSDRVVSIDVDPDLVATARARLRQVGYAPTLVAGDGMAGCPEHAPYDRLVATCGVGRVPDAWRQQVRPGGIMVVAVGYGIARLTVHEDHSAAGPFLPDLTAFMAARPTPDATSANAHALAGTLATAQGHQRAITVLAGFDSPGHQFLASLIHPDVTQITLTDEDGRHVHCLYSSDTESWARITMLDPREADLVYGGPRDLWAEREPVLRDWIAAGRPGIDRFRLTVDATGSHTLAIEAMSGSTRWELPGQ